jgi:MscS family membrane protein
MLKRSIMALIAVFLLLGNVQTAKAADRLEPGSYADITVDRSSPDLLLKTFYTALQRLVLRLEAREWARSHYDAWLYPAITEEQSAEINLLKEHILGSMDLSAFPDWRRESAGIETALMLWEIFRAEHVTEDTKFKQLRDGLWVIPGTYLQVGTVSSGINLGDVVFTAETVANVPSLYQLTPVAHGLGGFNVYQYFTQTPGNLEPPRWAGATHKLPRFLNWGLDSNTLLQWLITALIATAVLLIPSLLGHLIGAGSLRWFCQAAATGLLGLYASGAIINQVGLSGAGATVMTLLFLALCYGALVICIMVVGEWAGNWFSAMQQARDKTFDASIIQLATRVISTMSALAVIIYGISTAGVPVFGIIAGFGVGGLAFALAAKPTLENILASVILFLDGSIKVGDTIESDALSGVVEDIGMRSTRIRSRDGGLISVTNSELADKVIKNVSQRVSRPGAREASTEID